MKANQSRDKSLNIEKFYLVPWGLKRNKRQSKMNPLVRSCVDRPAMWKGFLMAFRAPEFKYLSLETAAQGVKQL